MTNKPTPEEIVEKKKKILELQSELELASPLTRLQKAGINFFNLVKPRGENEFFNNSPYLTLDQILENQPIFKDQFLFFDLNPFIFTNKISGNPHQAIKFRTIDLLTGKTIKESDAIYGKAVLTEIEVEEKIDDNKSSTTSGFKENQAQMQKAYNTYVTREFLCYHLNCVGNLDDDGNSVHRAPNKNNNRKPWDYYKKS